MADLIGRYTEKQGDILARKIISTYKEAAKDIIKKMNAFVEKHQARDAYMRAKVAAGTMTEAAYKRWLRGQVFIGKQWQQKLDDITRVYMQADKTSRQIIGGTTKNVFIKAANFTASDINKHLGGGISFNLYNRAAVEILLKNNPKLLPEWRIDEKKDYIWNSARVQNSVTQGIIQGESLDKISQRLATELSASNARKMDLFARTALTAAQSAGRIERMLEAQKMGIKLQKVWISAHDNKVRDAHAYLDGMSVDVDKPFVTEDGQKIMYPADPSAPPELVFNCRCDLGYFYPKVQKSASYVKKQQKG